MFINGGLKPGQDKEVPSKQKRWAVPGSAQGNAVLMPDKLVLTYLNPHFFLMENYSCF